MNKILYGFCLAASICLSSCGEFTGGVDVNDIDHYLGCYNYNNASILLINGEYVTDLRDGYNKIVRFVNIKGRDYILVESAIVISDGNNLNFRSGKMGFYYQLSKKGQNISLIVEDALGRDLEIFRSGNTCG